jgi:hypothetical protein
MLTNIPDADDFKTSAENLLNSAWNSLIKLLENHKTFEQIESEKDAIATYWLYAKPELTAAAAMVQHAVEFYLKSKIISISPYLLISIDARSLPKNSETQNLNYSEFRTLDAQDLLKIHNSFSPERLPIEFKSWFGEMRSMRNKIMHTVDKTISVEPTELAILILKCHEALVGANFWIASRTSYLDRSPEYGVRIGDENENHPYILLAIHRELSLVINELKPSDSKKYFKYNKKLQSERCPRCYNIFTQCEFFDCKWTDDFVFTLQPKSDASMEMHCIVCDYTTLISESKCEECHNLSMDKLTSQCTWCAINN